MAELFDILSSIVTVQCWGVERRVLSAEEWRLPPHYRQTMDVVNFMLAGSSTISMDGAEYLLEPGQAIFMPEGTEIDRSLATADATIDVLWIVFHLYTQEQLRLTHLHRPPLCLTGPTAEAMQRLVLQMREEWTAERPGKALVVNGLFLQLLATAYRAPAADIVTPIAVTPHAAAETPSTSGQEEIGHAVQFIAAHFAESLTFAQIAGEVCLHPHYFIRLFRRTIGISPMKFLEHTRLTEARRLLLNSNRSLHDIAQAVGYLDPYHFSRVFRRVTGQSPSAFRENVNRVHPARQSHPSR